MWGLNALFIWLDVCTFELRCNILAVGIVVQSACYIVFYRHPLTQPSLDRGAILLNGAGEPKDVHGKPLLAALTDTEREALKFDPEKS